ncbi:MAG: LptA/OstA family protein [Caulobacteraceae bacterium]|nr:LptA/OstA family protein [Caulobacteraceae bacterium]
MNRLTVPFALLMAASSFASLAPSVARAQLAASSHAPVDVTADQLEVQNAQCLAIWRGDAEALQETSRLRANTINIYNKVTGGKAGGSSCGPLDRMEADGAVYYVTPSQVVKGDHAVYSADAKTIVVTGQVVAAQGKNVIAGTRLIINSDTGQATMVSDVKGRGQSGRVRGVFYQDQTGQSTAPVPPPPRRHGA